MESEDLGTRQIEKILQTEIREWVRWGRNRDYLPPSFRCPLGFLYLPKRGDLEAALYRPAPINALLAADFEKLVIRLPSAHRQAFVMYHLNRAKINTKVIERKRTPQQMGQVLGVQKRRFYEILEQAHKMIFRDWQHRQEVENILKGAHKNTDL